MKGTLWRHSKIFEKEVAQYRKIRRGTLHYRSVLYVTFEKLKNEKAPVDAFPLHRFDRSLLVLVVSVKSVHCAYILLYDEKN